MKRTTTVCSVTYGVLCLMAGGCGTDVNKPADRSSFDRRDNIQAETVKTETQTPSVAHAVNPPETPRSPGLREAIVGRWIARGFSDNPETMTFSKDGRFSRWAISTTYSGTYKVLDERTVVIESASVLSGMRLTKDTLVVTLKDGVLQIAGRSSMGFRRDKTTDSSYFDPAIGGQQGRRQLQERIVGTWKEATFAPDADVMTFSEIGSLTFSGPPRNTGSYRVVDANTIEVSRSAFAFAAFVPPERWTVKLDGDRLEIKGRTRSYVRVQDMWACLDGLLQSQPG